MPAWLRSVFLRRFGDEPSSADSRGLGKDKCSRGPAGNWAGQLSTSQTNTKESASLKMINDNTRPTTGHMTAKGKNFVSAVLCLLSDIQPTRTRPSIVRVCLRMHSWQTKPFCLLFGLFIQPGIVACC